MTVKSVLDVEINDEAFKRYSDLFNQYRTKVAEMPGLWGAANEEILNTRTAFVGITAAILAQTEGLKRALTAQRDYGKEVDKSAASWSSVAKATKSVSENIYTATSSLLRWASIGGALSGLLGIGGIFGLDKFAGSAGNARRSAQGVGANIGEQQAFDLNFGRYVDSESLVGGVNDALTDPSKRFALIGSGASAKDIASGDAIKIAADILPNLKKIADQTQTQFLGAAIQTHGLQGIVTAETLRRLKAISPQELSEAQGNFNKDASTLNVTDSDARAWQDLNRQLKEAGKQIETTFINGLTPLTGPLKDLSHAFSDVVSEFLKAAKDQGWIEAISAGLEEFAKYIGTQDFKDDVKEFVQDIGIFATDIKKALQWIGVIPDKDAQPADQTPPSSTNLYPGGPYVGPNMGVDPLHPFGKSSSGGRDDLDHWLDGIKKVESGGDAGAVSKKGALGPYQLMPDTAQGLGVANPFDEQQSRGGAKKLLQALLKEFGGNMDEALAAYNWGSGNVRRDITQHGDAWRQYLPRETQNYIVRVENATGGNTIVTTSQLPQ